jgi:hypothetical protein
MAGGGSAAGLGGGGVSEQLDLASLQEDLAAREF